MHGFLKSVSGGADSHRVGHHSHPSLCVHSTGQPPAPSFSPSKATCMPQGIYISCMLCSEGAILAPPASLLLAKPRLKRMTNYFTTSPFQISDQVCFPQVMFPKLSEFICGRHPSCTPLISVLPTKPQEDKGLPIFFESPACSSLPLLAKHAVRA